MKNFDESLKVEVSLAEEILNKYLPKECTYQKTVVEAMEYSAMAGGKRLRPIIMKASAGLFANPEEVKTLEPFMAALEMIHNYSLVHDDLPCMDNDEYRRGKKTTHVVYGEGMAVLAGDGLLNYAFETAAKAFDLCESLEDYKRASRAMQILGKKAGIYGMIGGQCGDILAENTTPDEELLLYIHKNKTAALIEAAFMIGAILGGAADSDVEGLEKCAENVGIAFQIEDDILDVTSSTEVLGKPVGSDEKNNKITYVTLKGLEASQKEVEERSLEAFEIIKGYGDKGEFLGDLIKMLINRKK